MQENRNTLTVNGKEHPHSPGLTVTGLLESVLTGEGLEKGTVVVEVNAAIVPRERFAETPLNPGDIVEIVHFVGGG